MTELLNKIAAAGDELERARLILEIMREALSAADDYFIAKELKFYAAVREFNEANQREEVRL